MLCDNAWLQQVIPESTIHGIPNNTPFNLSIAIDSRTLSPGNFFLALKGERVDGHDYVEQALANGAEGIIIEKQHYAHVQKKLAPSTKIIVVPHTMNALIELAKAYRASLTMPIVGITGSVGKTSTKEIIQSIFKAASVSAFVSHKNQNTIIGVCMNMLNVAPNATYAVFELGINEVGEMEELVDVVQPTIALITTVALAHGEKIGTLADISREKRMIFSRFSPTNIGIINGDNLLLTGVSYAHPIARFGTKTNNHVQARKIKIVEKEHRRLATTFTLKWYHEKATVTLSSHHQGMVYNALAAASIAYHLGISFDAVVKGIETFTGIWNRFEHQQMTVIPGTLISDCYNANPESMKAALIAFDHIRSSGKKIVILGDMLELGERSIYWHRRVSRLLKQLKSIDEVILVGNLASHMGYALPSSIPVHCVATWHDACTLVQKRTGDNNPSCILVKGSRGVQLHNLVDSLCK